MWAGAPDSAGNGMSAAGSIYALPSSDSEDDGALDDIDLGDHSNALTLDEMNKKITEAVQLEMKEIEQRGQEKARTKRKGDETAVTKTPQKRRRTPAKRRITSKASARADTVLPDTQPVNVSNEDGLRQKRDLETLLRQHNLCAGTDGCGWGYNGKNANYWYENYDGVTPESAIHNKQYYFMCGVTDRLMRFYSQYPENLPPRWIGSAEGNDWRLCNFIWSDEEVHGHLSKYMRNKVLKEYYLKNEALISSLRNALNVFLSHRNLHPYVRRLAFAAACGVFTMQLIATQVASNKINGAHLMRRIQQSLRYLLGECGYEEDLQVKLGVKMDELPEVVPLDETTSAATVSAASERVTSAFLLRF